MKKTSTPSQIKPYEAKPGEKYMSKDQLAHFRALLNAWKKDLLEGGDDAIFALKEQTDAPSDVSDQASLEESFSLQLKTRDREYKLINKIEDSIQLIDDNKYGFCKECGAEIGIQRLEARPTAILCFDCKTIAEEHEKQKR